MSFSIFTDLCNHRHNPFQSMYITLKRSPMAFSYHPLLSPWPHSQSQPQASTSLLYVFLLVSLFWTFIRRKSYHAWTSCDFCDCLFSLSILVYFLSCRFAISEGYENFGKIPGRSHQGTGYV